MVPFLRRRVLGTRTHADRAVNTERGDILSSHSGHSTVGIPNFSNGKIKNSSSDRHLESEFRIEHLMISSKQSAQCLPRQDIDQSQGIGTFLLNYSELSDLTELMCEHISQSRAEYSIEIYTLTGDAGVSVDDLQLRRLGLEECRHSLNVGSCDQRHKLGWNNEKVPQ